VARALWEHITQWFQKKKVLHKKAKKLISVLTEMTTEVSPTERKFADAIKVIERYYDKGIKIQEIDEFVNNIMNIRKRKEYEKYSNAENVVEDISSFKIIERIPNPKYKKPQPTEWAKQNRARMEKYLEEKKLYKKILSNKSVLNVDTSPVKEVGK
jgi:hypothetical protein